MAVFVLVSDGAYAERGVTAPKGVGVGRIEYDPNHDYDPPPGATVVPEKEFTGDYWDRNTEVPIPETVAKWRLQVLLGRMPSRLGNAGSVLDDANALAKMVGGEVELIWANASEINRASPMMHGMAQRLGLNDADLDGIYIKAAELAV